MLSHTIIANEHEPLLSAKKLLPCCFDLPWLRVNFHLQFGWLSVFNTIIMRINIINIKNDKYVISELLA